MEELLLMIPRGLFGKVDKENSIFTIHQSLRNDRRTFNSITLQLEDLIFILYGIVDLCKNSRSMCAKEDNEL